MPNLTLIDQAKSRSKLATFKHFGRLFTHLKKSLSRKSLNADVSETAEDDSAFAADESVDEKPIKNVLLRRMHSNRRVYEKLRTKSHIYSDRSDTRMSSLFDYCLVVSVRNIAFSNDQLSSDRYVDSPNIQWMFPDNPVNLNESIAEFCFPDPSCQYDLGKKSGNETFQFTLTNLDASRTYGNCIKIVS